MLFCFPPIWLHDVITCPLINIFKYVLCKDGPYLLRQPIESCTSRRCLLGTHMFNIIDPSCLISGTSFVYHFLATKLNMLIWSAEWTQLRLYARSCFVMRMLQQGLVSPVILLWRSQRCSEECCYASKVSQVDILLENTSGEKENTHKQSSVITRAPIYFNTILQCVFEGIYRELKSSDRPPLLCWNERKLWPDAGRVCVFRDTIVWSPRACDEVPYGSDAAISDTAFWAASLSVCADATRGWHWGDAASPPPLAHSSHHVSRCKYWSVCSRWFWVHAGWRFVYLIIEIVMGAYENTSRCLHNTCTRQAALMRSFTQGAFCSVQ